MLGGKKKIEERLEYLELRIANLEDGTKIKEPARNNDGYEYINHLPIKDCLIALANALGYKFGYVEKKKTEYGVGVIKKN